MNRSEKLQKLEKNGFINKDTNSYRNSAHRLKRHILRWFVGEGRAQKWRRDRGRGGERDKDIDGEDSEIQRSFTWCSPSILETNCKACMQEKSIQNQCLYLLIGSILRTPYILIFMTHLCTKHHSDCCEVQETYTSTKDPCMPRCALISLSFLLLSSTTSAYLLA